MASDTWDTLAIPILEAIAEVEGSNDPSIEVEGLCSLLGRDWPAEGRRVSVELRRLIDAGYIAGKLEGTFAGPAHDFLINPHLSDRGARAVGRWPSTDPYEALLQYLERAAQETDDPDRKAALKKVAGTVGEVGQGVLTNVLAAVVRASAGLP
jgi:hypothetical protein